MAVDRKGDHVGDHGGRYTDIDGITRQFTYVDHDRHTTRLKIFSYDKKVEEKSPLQILVDLIIEKEINDHPLFIQHIDTTLAEKYGYERFRKNSTVTGENLLITHRGDEWLNDLKEIYDKLTQ